MTAKKGIALIFALFAITILTVFGATVAMRSVHERSITQRHVESTQAYWLAQAGLSYAVNQLAAGSSDTGEGVWFDDLPNDDPSGRYSVDVEDITIGSQAYKKITSHGLVPADNSRIERVLEATVLAGIPPDFFEYVVYSAGDIDFNGTSFSVSGKVIYAGEKSVEHEENITGTVTYDTTISPLARFDFQQLLEISEGQQNVYSENRQKKLINETTGLEGFPSGFWYSEGVPNIIYVKDNLTLNGAIGTVGGFFVVAGDVLTDPEATEDAVVNGNGQIDGIIYTRGEFNVTGGGGADLNINGAIWGAGGAGINGSVNVSYNQSYMDAIKELDISSEFQLIGWRDTQNPYSITSE